VRKLKIDWLDWLNWLSLVFPWLKSALISVLTVRAHARVEAVRPSIRLFAVSETVLA